MIVFAVVIFVLLVMLKAVSPHISKYSEFERDRRASRQESEIEREVLRHDTYSDAVMWLSLKEMVLMTALTLLLANSYGVVRGIVYAAVALVVYRILSRIPFLRKLVQKLYDTYEMTMLHGVQKLRPIARLVHKQKHEVEKDIASREELEYVVEQSSRFLGNTERSLTVSAFNFADKTVADYMTLRADIDAIAKDELLGPLVLDDLHKTGHSQFPVIDGDLDHIVGILNIDSFLSVRDRQSLGAKNAMNAQVSYIRGDETLMAAFAVFVGAKQQLLIVINEHQKTIGMVSLEDVTRELFGRDIASGFDDHESRTAVASRRPR